MAATNQEYELRELASAHKHMTRIETAPIDDRKEAAASFFEAMQKLPELIAERIGWLIDGNYGYGEMLMAKRVLGSPRMNRSAVLVQLIGAFEWQSPGAMTRAAWKKLSRDQQVRLEMEVQAAIRMAEAEAAAP